MAENPLQKRLSEVIGSVRYLTLSDFPDYERGEDEVVFKADDPDEPGRLIAQFSVSGMKDSYGDIITQAALDEHNGKSLAMVWSHDRSKIIGKGTFKMEGKRAIWDGHLFVGKGVADADMARTVITEMGKQQEYSWGFRIKEAKPIKEKGPDGQMIWLGGLEITKLDPIEVSPVLKGAHPKTRTILIKEDVEPVVLSEEGDVILLEPARKGLRVSEQHDAARAAVEAFISRLESLAETRAKENRPLNDTNIDRLEEVKAELAAGIARIEALLQTARASKPVPIGNRFRDLELRMREIELMETGD